MLAVKTVWIYERFVKFPVVILCDIYIFPNLGI